MDDSAAAVKHAANAMSRGVASIGNRDGSDSGPSRSAAQHSTGVAAADGEAGLDALAAATREAKAVAEAGALWRRDYQTLIKRARQLVARREQLAWSQASVAAWYASLTFSIMVRQYFACSYDRETHRQDGEYHGMDCLKHRPWQS